jgi:hypothetical protein
VCYHPPFKAKCSSKEHRLPTTDIFPPPLLDASISQCFFPLLGAGQRFLFNRDGVAPGVLYLLGLDGVEFGIFGKLCREIAFCIDGVYRTNLDACRAIDALIRVNDELGLQFVKAGDRAYFYTVGKLASVAFLGDDVGHRVRVVMRWIKKPAMPGRSTPTIGSRYENTQISVIDYWLWNAEDRRFIEGLES